MRSIGKTPYNTCLFSIGMSSLSLKLSMILVTWSPPNTLLKVFIRDGQKDVKVTRMDTTLVYGLLALHTTPNTLHIHITMSLSRKLMKKNKKALSV